MSRATTLAALLWGVFGALVLYLSIEGLHALAGGRKPSPALFVQLRERLRERPLSPEQAGPALAQVLTDRAELEALFDDFRAARISLGNTPYLELATDEARFTVLGEDGILRNKPNVTLWSAQLRTRLFHSYDPVVLNRLGGGDDLPPRVRALVTRYGFRETLATTDANGDRTTLPRSDAHPVVLVIGDSLAFGTGLDDDETLASVLQRRFPSARVVNASVPSGATRDNLARLRERLEEFGDRVVALVYFFCENDIDRGVPGSSVLAPVNELTERHGVKARTLVYGQFLYRTAPEIVRATTERFEQVSDEELLAKMVFRREMEDSARELGFHVVDTWEIVQRYREQELSLFAGMALYVDHTHWSPRGTRLIADAVAAPDGALATALR
jgi:lysophospholipase L1-like esterase